jgi:dTDP-4-dehydrorhamnose reductase
MKVLLIGKTGQLGGDLIHNNPGYEIYAPSREELDIGNREQVEELIANHSPDIVINTAAFHNVPLCETDPVSAFQFNCVAVRNLASACRKVRSLFVTFSTDYVFGGEKRTPYLENDSPQPIQMYGVTRVAGEFSALAAAPDQAIVIRTCGLYGTSGAQSKGGNFVDKRIQDAANSASLEMGCDQIVSPTSTYDLSRAIWPLIEHPGLKPGIYHLVNEGECTWYEFTKAIYEIAGLNISVTPVDRGGMSGDMRRPLYSALANTKARALGIALPSWRAGLERYIVGKYGTELKK